MFRHHPHHDSGHRLRIARAAVAAGLGVALASAGIPATAWGGEATLTINQLHNEGATYDAYCLFTADVSDKDVATHIAWASPEIRRVVLAFLDKEGYETWLGQEHSGDDQHDHAQNAAEFISLKIGMPATDGGGATKPRTVEARSFAHRLAQALATSNEVSPHPARAGEAFSGAEGYWLFVTTKDSTEGRGEAGTVPLWATLGGSLTTINEKTAVPSVVKEVKEDSTGSWGKVADAHTNQDLAYRLTATLPNNIHSFERYHLRFTDTLSAGLELSAPADDVRSALTVRINNQAVPVDATGWSATYRNNTLTVDFADLKDTAWESFNISDESTITVEYTAHLHEGQVLGGAGNSNGVSLTYTDDPVWNSEGQTKDATDTTKTFAYQLTVSKQDKQTGEALSGASFTVQVADTNSDSASRTRYVQADGSLGTEAHAFVTDDKGTFSIKGIDEGTYLVSEVTPPHNFSPLSQPITFTITSGLDGTGQTLSTLVAEMGEPGKAQPSPFASISSVDTETGVINMRVTNDRQLLMPLTGMEGLGASSAAGAVMLVGAIGGIALNRRHHQ